MLVLFSTLLQRLQRDFPGIDIGELLVRAYEALTCCYYGPEGYIGEAARYETLSYWFDIAQREAKKQGRALLEFEEELQE